MAAQITSFTYQFYLASKKGKLPNHVSSTENIVKTACLGFWVHLLLPTNQLP